MAPFNRLYQFTIVSTVLSCTIFYISDIDYRDLEIQVTCHSPCEFMHDLYVAKIYRVQSRYFAADMIS